jgi:recombinational DNA repair protein RecT
MTKKSKIHFIAGFEKEIVWTVEDVENLQEQFKNQTLKGLYERENIEDITLYAKFVIFQKTFQIT